MKKKLTRDVFLALHESLISRFKTENPTYSERSYLLYGYNEYSTQNTPSLKCAILRKYKKQGKESELYNLFKGKKDGEISYNGKYLWDMRFVRLKEEPEITVNEAYLKSWLFYLDFNDLDQFITQMLEERSIKIQHKLRQDQLLAYTKEKPLKLRCSFFSPISDKMDSFTLTILGEQVEINDAPSGRTYVGKIFNKEFNRRINLISKGEQLSPGYLTIIFKNNDGGWLKSSMTVGYYACFSESDTMAGAIILEKQFTIEDYTEPVDLDNIADKVGLIRKQEYIFKQMDSDKDPQLFRNHLKDLCSFIDDKFIRDKYKIKTSSSDGKLTRGEMFEKLLTIKKDYFKIYLKNKYLYTTHGDFKYYNDFARHINEKYKGWGGSQYLLKIISGYYVAYIPRVFRRNSDSQVTRKMEQCLFKFGSDGKIVCHSIGAGDFTGTISMKNQRIAHLSMTTENEESFYHINFEIPIHQIPYGATEFPKKESLKLKFKGIYSGVDRRNLPVSNKIYFRELNIRDYVTNEFQPRYFDLVEDERLLNEINKVCPEIKLFFSTRAHDSFLEGGNIFFDNFISFPNNQGSLKDYEGVYEVYRSSNSTLSKKESIKKFPLEIKRNGTAILKYRYQSIFGKVLLYGKRLILQFSSNGHKKFDSTIMVHLFDPKQTDSLEGLILSANENDEPYVSEVLIFKVKDTQVTIDDIDYKTIFVDDRKEFGDLNNIPIHGFTKIGNKIFDLKSTSHRLMGRNHLFDKKNKLDNDNDSHGLNGNANGNEITKGNLGKSLLDDETVLKITVDNLIYFYFTKNEQAKNKIKTMGELLEVIFDNVDDVIEAELSKSDYNLIEDQPEKILNLWQKRRKRTLASKAYFNR